MNNKQTASLLSFLASICFFITYFTGKETINLILGCCWLCIAIGNFANTKKK